MISINKETCKKCLLCCEVCPNNIIAANDTHDIAALPNRVDLCFACGQCMAVCASRSIVVEGLLYERDFFDLPHESAKEASFYNLIASRRAIRNFKDKPVPKDVLEKIVTAISFAPPGFPPLKTKLIVVQNTELIRKALPGMITLYDKLVRAMRNPIISFFIKREVGKQKFKTMQQHLLPVLESRLPNLKNGTEDTLTRNAPAMILFVADRNDEDIRQDIYIAATYGMLATHSLGLGGSIMDIIPPAIERDKELRALFCIPDNHEVVTSIIIGYPKYTYQRGIKRNVKSVTWL